jgi:hypothetical protein
MGAQTIHDDPTRETRAYEVEQQDFSADTEEPLAHFLRHVRAGRNGLSSREADRRVLVFGANKLRKRVQRTWPRDLARQFTHPLALLLWMASALAIQRRSASGCVNWRARSRGQVLWTRLRSLLAPKTRTRRSASRDESPLRPARTWRRKCARGSSVSALKSCCSTSYARVSRVGSSWIV